MLEEILEVAFKKEAATQRSTSKSEGVNLNKLSTNQRKGGSIAHLKQGRKSGKKKAEKNIFQRSELVYTA